MKRVFFRQIYETLKRYRVRLILLVIFVALIITLSQIKYIRSVSDFISSYISFPVRNGLAFLCSFTDWSVAEWQLILFALFVAVFVICLIVALIKNFRNFFSVLIRYLSFVSLVAAIIGFLVVLLLNVPYYSKSFSEKSGIVAEKSSTDDLYMTTKAVAMLLKGSADSVSRDENGVFNEKLETLFNLSPSVYRNIERDYPFLKGYELRAKKVLFSFALSTIRTTGVAYPLTGEANINIHQPAAYIPATIAHEIAHQRGISSESEANFVAILACDLSGDNAYRYSGYLFAYGYLASALAEEDYDRYLEITKTLPTGVLSDLKYHYEYWKQFENEISEYTDSIYDDFLKSQGQDLGIKSYGAVVDLLIAYYK